MSSDLEDYLREVLRLFIDRAKEAKHLSKTVEGEAGARQRVFEESRALAYYEVVSTLVGQASVFGLSKQTIPELNFDPDIELLS